MGQSVMQDDWFAVFKFRVTVKAHLIKYDCFCHICWTAYLFATKFNWRYIIISWSALSKNILLFSRSRSQKRFRIPVNVHLDNISSTAELSLTNLGMLMHHHGPECLARRLVCCLQVQGHSEGSFNQIWLFLPYLLNCWSFCNQI